MSFVAITELSSGSLCAAYSLIDFVDSGIDSCSCWKNRKKP